jgi:hypothetical protein
VPSANIVDVLGLDLGHGETALAFLRGDEDKGTIPRKVFDSDITAIAYLKSGEIVRGRAAIQQSISGEGEIKTLDVCFKSKPGVNIVNDKLTADFAYSSFQDAIKEAKLDVESIEVFIGCPSGWSEKTKDKYKELFTEAKIPNVTVIRESEAAYAYYFGVLRGSAEYQEFTLGELEKLPLILDFGSSTLDVTLEKKVGDPITEGISLGAGLIDEALLHWNLIHCLDEDYPVTRGMSSDFEDTIEELKSILTSNRSAYSRALIEAREAKQTYWNRRKQTPKENPVKFSAMPDFLPGIRLPLYVDDKLMNLILTSQLKEVLPDNFEISLDEEIGDIKNYSWLECCQKFLDIKFRQELNKYDLTFSDVGVVVFTGGASLMPPVRTVIENFFPDIDKKLVRYDTEPSLCIAKGLAARGRMELITRDFEKEILEFCGDKENGLYKIIGEQFGEKLYVNLLTLLGDKLGDLTSSELKRWQEGYIDRHQIGSNIQDKFRTWSNSNDLAKKIEQELRTSETIISEKINNKLMPIIEKYFDQEIEFISTGTSFFMTKTYAEIFHEYSEVFGVELDFDYSSKGSLVTYLQSIPQILSQQLDDNPSWLDFSSRLKDVSIGFGARWWQVDESKMKTISYNFKKINYEMIVEVLKSEQFINNIVYPAALAMQTALRGKINQEKYVLYALS